MVFWALKQGDWETTTRASGPLASPPLGKVLPPSRADNYPVRPRGAKASQGKSKLRPGLQDPSQDSVIDKMSTTQIHPEPGSSFVVFCKQDNDLETKCLPSYKFVHPSFCPYIHLSIYLSIHPFIHSFVWPCCWRRARNGCHCFVSVALALWPKEALTWAGHGPMSPILGESLSRRRGTWPGEQRPGDCALSWCFSITLFRGSVGHGQGNIL